MTSVLSVEEDEVDDVVDEESEEDMSLEGAAEMEKEATYVVEECVLSEGTWDVSFADADTNE